MHRENLNSLLLLWSHQIDIYADVRNESEIQKFQGNNIIKGFTTNPTLLRKGGIKNYLDFINNSIQLIENLNISIEVLADDFNEMYRQAVLLSKISKQIYIKIPIYNTKHESSIRVIKKLIDSNCPLNITAIMTFQQLDEIKKVLNSDSDVIVSIFAGRIADTGVNPIPVMKYSVKLFEEFKNVRTLWASPRELLNINQAIESGCHIITAVPEILSKLNLIGKDLDQYSLETVQMFYGDAVDSGFKL